MQSVQLKTHNISIGGDRLAVIAGLNVLEDAALAHEVASELKTITARLNLPFIFKASYDKANRSSIQSYRGPGLTKGLAILNDVKARHNVAIATDIHEPHEAAPTAAIADIVQIPAFLARQTNLITAAAQETAAQAGILHIKKPQFMAPQDCANIINKAREAAAAIQLVLCERGTNFGYNNLVVDMLGIRLMQSLGVPVSIDATHAVQLPGTSEGGAVTGGRRDGVEIIAQASIAAGADALFLEFHPTPDKALCDAASCLPLDQAENILTRCAALYDLLHQN